MGFLNGVYIFFCGVLGGSNSHPESTKSLPEGKFSQKKSNNYYINFPKSMLDGFELKWHALYVHN